MAADSLRETLRHALDELSKLSAQELTQLEAAELNQRPVALVETYHDGPLPQADSYAAVDAPNVVLSAMKRAEDNDDLIVRCYETGQSACAATIRLPRWNRTIEARFRPCEIKTFRVPKDEALPVVETNLIEWDE